MATIGTGKWFISSMIRAHCSNTFRCISDPFSGNCCDWKRQRTWKMRKRLIKQLTMFLQVHANCDRRNTLCRPSFAALHNEANGCLEIALHSMHPTFLKTKNCFSHLCKLRFAIKRYSKNISLIWFEFRQIIFFFAFEITEFSNRTY